MIVHAAPTIIRIIEAVEELQQNPGLIHSLRLLARENVQQPSPSRSVDVDTVHHLRGSNDTARTRVGRNMRPCGTCSSIKVKVSGTESLSISCPDRIPCSAISFPMMEIDAYARGAKRRTF